MRFVSLTGKNGGAQKEAEKLRVMGSPILEDIDEVLRQLRYNSERFDQVCDDDLLESIIYEQNALMAHYRYLIKTAKRDGVALPKDSLQKYVTI